MNLLQFFFSVSPLDVALYRCQSAGCYSKDSKDAILTCARKLAVKPA